MTRRVAVLAAGALASCAVGVGALAASGSSGRPSEPVEPVAAGADLFQARSCVACHTGPEAEATIPDRRLVGPSLRDAATWAGSRRAGYSAAAYLAESIREPDAFYSPAAPTGVRMPDLGLSDAEVDALVAYLLDP